MKQIKQAIASFTAFSFLLGTLIPAPSVYADGTATSNTANTSGSGQVINGLSNIVGQLGTTPGLFTQNPQQLQMQSAIASMQAQMNACLTKAVAGSKTAADAKSLLSAEYAKVFQSKLAKAKGQDTASLDQIACYQKASCDTECGEPQINPSPVCGAGNLDSDQKLIRSYIDYLTKTSKCANSDFEALQKQKAVMDCQMQVLQQGVNQASQALQQVLQANATQYGKMNQYMGELGDQMGQISALVGGAGPDGKEMPGKWTELQKSLYDNFNQMTENEAKFKNDSNNLSEQTKQNEAYLDATKAQKFGVCLLNTDAPNSAKVQCWRPRPYSKDDRSCVKNVNGTCGNVNGCSVYDKGLCSPAQAGRSSIEMSYLVSNGQPYQDPDRCSAAIAASANFDSMMGDISSKLGTDLNSWSDIQKTYGSQINPTAMSYLQRGASVCTANADNWKRNAQNPNKAKMDKEAQQYAQKKTELDNKKNELSSSLDAALTGMNKAYSDVMAALSDQAVSLNTIQCTKDNPSTMQQCYADIRSNLKNLLQGSGGVTMTTKTIKGGTMTPGFAAPCSGLDGCITTYRTIRDKLNDQARLASQAKQKFVQDGNTQVQQQLQQFSQFLATTQQNVLKQYDQMKNAFAALGITPPDALKTLDVEQFEQMDGPNGEKGPFKQPKSMASVLSGMVQPGGLINFSDTGMKDSFAEAQDKLKAKKAAKAETIKDWKDVQRDYVKTVNECSKDRVASLLADCNRCKSEQQSMKTAILGGSNKDLLSTTADALAKTLNLSSLVSDNLSDECKSILLSCNSASGKPLYGGSEEIKVGGNAAKAQ